MSSADHMTRFERHVRMLLEQNVQQTGGHVRSRLNQARHAALAQSLAEGVSRITRRRLQLWMPAAGVAVAAAVAAFMLLPHHPRRAPSSQAARTVASSDLDLLTDRDGLTLVENGDGEFYEWAVYESQAQQRAGSEADHAR